MVLRQALQVQEVINPPGEPGCSLHLALDGPRVVGTVSRSLKWGSGSGSVGRAVASNTRGLRFESSHWQNLLNICLLSAVLKSRKWPGMAHFLKKFLKMNHSFLNDLCLSVGP